MNTEWLLTPDNKWIEMVEDGGVSVYPFDRCGRRLADSEIRERLDELKPKGGLLVTPLPV